MPGQRAFFLLLLTTLACTHARPRRRPPAPPPAPEPCQEAEPLALLIDGAPNLNPGPDGQSLPTVVRVYQLRGTARLEAASIDEMTRNDRGVLADEVLEIKEVTLLPGGRALPDLPRNPRSTHVAVTALFRRPHASSWRAVAPLPPPDAFHCHRDQPRWIQFFLRDYDALVVPLPQLPPA